MLFICRVIPRKWSERLLKSLVVLCPIASQTSSKVYHPRDSVLTCTRLYVHTHPRTPVIILRVSQPQWPVPSDSVEQGHGSTSIRKASVKITDMNLSHIVFFRFQAYRRVQSSGSNSVTELLELTSCQDRPCGPMMCKAEWTRISALGKSPLL